MTLAYPQPPASPESLARAYVEAQAALPAGWWITLRNEYGPEAFWIALAEVPQADMENDYLEAVGDIPEDALADLQRQIESANLKESRVDGVPAPQWSKSAEAFADAWRAAEESLPRGWWIAGVAGLEGAGSEAGWMASANGGPTSNYSGRQSLGNTPEDAIRALAQAT